VKQALQLTTGHTSGRLDQSPHLGIPESPYLTLDEGALFCRFDARVSNPNDMREQFRRWLHRNRVPVRRVGRTVLVERRHLEAFLRGDRWTR
jgi:hypothetical protein